MKHTWNALLWSCLLACLAGACTRRTNMDMLAQIAAQEAASTFYLFSSMESDKDWRVDSATDPAILSGSDTHFSEGDAALSCAFQYEGAGKVEIRREIDLDLWPARHLKLDVFCADGPVNLAIAFRTRPGSAYFETPQVTLAKGWNREVVFPISGKVFKTGEREGSYQHPLKNAHKISRLSFILYSLDLDQGEVFLDNLRFDAPARELLPGIKPEILQISLSATNIKRFETLEITAACRLSYASPFDPKEARFFARIEPPEGEPFEVPGFFDGEDAQDPLGSTWKIRFTPQVFGQYRLDVTIANKKGEAISEPAAFICQQEAIGPGFVTIGSHHQYMEFTNHELFFPLGQNIAWATDYERYFKKIHAYGGNYARIWMCPWNLPLEDRTKVGHYTLETAQRLDQILQLAKQYGIYVQLVLEYHGMLGYSWKENPYNAAQDGPCYNPKEFFTNKEARQYFKQRLDYILARWSSSPVIAGWELWNEVTLTPYDEFDEVLQWHREMCAYLHAHDLYKHLITTSGTTTLRHAELFDLAGLDFLQIHTYNPSPPDAFEREFVNMNIQTKPFFVGEFGSGWLPEKDQEDTRGVRLHAGLWSSLLSPSAGCALPWWWDTQIDPFDLYYHFAAVAAYKQGEDFRQTKLHWRTGKVAISNISQADLWGLFGTDRAYIWLYDRDRIKHLKRDEGPFLKTPFTLRVQGLTNGKYSVTLWDTYTGKITATLKLETVGSHLEVPIPASAQDLALKIKRTPPALPGFDDGLPENHHPTNAVIKP